MNKLIGFFDLYSQHRDTRARAQGITDTDVAGWRQCLVYLACVVGIVLGPHAAAAAAGNFPEWSVVFDSWSRIIWAILFGVVLTAFLFKVLVTPKAALVIQLGVALAVGFGSAKLVPLALQFFSNAAGG